ncbi:MAG: FapA family protein [Nitrospirae bacterium]|nr:FapA family protein [Nitrospirota bacterium]MCL5236843.1 FapA family protein [Nitrospirota bacterium]
MKKIRVGDLQEGMVIAADVFEAGSGVRIPFIRKGVALNNNYISRLKGRGIGYVLIETPQGYRGAPGEVLTLDAVHEDILFDGKVQINGKVSSQVKIEAGERIVIEGDVGEGCIFLSAKGGIMIKGSVYGTREEPVRIDVSQNILIHDPAGSSVNFADIKAGGDISISGNIGDSSVSARGGIVVDGAVMRSQVLSQVRIKIRDCGDKNLEPCVLMVKPFECRELSQEILKLDSGLSELLKERERLQNVIDLIKKLGRDIEQLTQEKRIELAAGVKRFREIEGEIVSFQSKKAEVKREMEQHLGIKRIMVAGSIYPRTKITIENSSVEMASKELGIAFYVKDFKVISSPYSGGL